MNEQFVFALLPACVGKGTGAAVTEVFGVTCGKADIVACKAYCVACAVCCSVFPRTAINAAIITAIALIKRRLLHFCPFDLVAGSLLFSDVKVTVSANIRLSSLEVSTELCSFCQSYN
jgi:hypothetical protein